MKTIAMQSGGSDRRIVATLLRNASVSHHLHRSTAWLAAALDVTPVGPDDRADLGLILGEAHISDLASLLAARAVTAPALSRTILSLYASGELRRSDMAEWAKAFI